MTDERHGHYAHLDDGELADKVDELARHAKLCRGRGQYDAAAMWEENAQLAQDELDVRKDTDNA